MKIDTFLIGVQKAGTSSLYNWIAQHPDVYGPETIKDYHYWISPVLNKVGWPFIEKQFQHAESHQLKMMGGVNYFYHCVGAKLLHEHNPKAKLLLILRNPIKRAQSAHAYFTKLGQETFTFSEALKREAQDQFKTYEEISNWTYIDHGMYYKQLVRFLEFFPRENIHILFFEDMVGNNLEAVQETYKFLGINDQFVPDFIKVNETGMAKYLWLNRLLFGKKGLGKLVSILAKILPLTWRIKFGNWIRERNKKTGQFNQQKVESNTNDLDDYFIQDVKKLSDLLKIDLIKKWSLKED